MVGPKEDMMIKKCLPYIVVAAAALSLASVHAKSARTVRKDPQTVSGFCDMLRDQGIGVPAGLKEMELQWSLLQSNFNRMIAARAEVTACEAAGERNLCSADLVADAKRRAFETELSFRNDVKEFAAKFEK
jgi:hypothetical protein